MIPHEFEPGTYEICFKRGEAGLRPLVEVLKQLDLPFTITEEGKSFDSFAPLGPMLVSKDAVSDPHHLNIAMRLNGETMQQSNTQQLIFRIDELIVYLSQVCTLKPGDLLFTGTPPGVGAARTPPVFLQPGDVAEVEIENIGVLKNPVVAAGA